MTRARARTGLSAGPGHGSIYLSPGLSPAASWLLGMAVRALPPQVLLAFPASALASLASTGSCTLPSPTSPPSTGACVVHLPAACSAPAPMGPPRASSTCLVREVLVGTQGGLGARAHPPLQHPPFHSAQGPPLGHLRLQPLREHGLREAGSAASGGHRGHGLRGLWHHWPQPHPAGGQPCHWRPGRWARSGQVPQGPRQASRGAPALGL